MNLYRSIQWVIIGLAVGLGMPGAVHADAPELQQRLEQLEAQVERLQQQANDDAALADDARRLDEAGYGDDFEMTFWVWLSYIYRDQPPRSTFWAWEVELSVTKVFTDAIAATFDIDVIDTSNGARVELEQAFLSLLVWREHATVLTLGKFNAPFGIEPRDFWDRLAGSTSLLFRAQPQDLTGVMLTQPVGPVTLQGFAVNGFDQNLANNHQPSVGLVTAWEPHQDVHLAVTHYWGPEMDDRVGDKLYLIVAEANWYLTPRLSLAGQYLWGSTASPAGRQTWAGGAGIINVDLSQRWRAFGRWSYLDDRDGFVSGPRRQQEFGLGAAFYLLPELEFRTEYRRDWLNPGANRHSVFAHVTYGF